MTEKGRIRIMRTNRNLTKAGGCGVWVKFNEELTVDRWLNELSNEEKKEIQKKLTKLLTKAS